MEIEQRKYKDQEGKDITEHTHRGMRLRVYINEKGVKLYNYDDLNTLWNYEGEMIFEFLNSVMGDELWNYLQEQGKA